MKIKKKLQKEISNAIKKEFNLNIPLEEIEVTYPPSGIGDLTTNISYRIAKQKGLKPYDVAMKIADLVSPKFSSVIVSHGAVNGFSNFVLNDKVYIKNLDEILSGQEKYGKSKELKCKRIMVEFAHPNPFKAFHIGHLRNIILGESIVRMLESQGAEVIRTNYQGDVGMHIAKCLWAFRKISPKDYPSSSDERISLIGKCYAQGATAFEENEQAKKEIEEINKKIYSGKDKEINKLWELGKKWSLDKFHEIYKRVYSTFEREYMESETLSTCMRYIEQAKEKGILKESKRALIFNGSKYGLDTRVFLNAQGLPTYEGKELGLAYMEFNDFGNIDLCIHNVAVEQISFFKVTFKVEELLDPARFKGKQYHNAYEFVGLKKGKMSSRKGNVILGNDILDEAHKKITEIIKDRKEIKDIDDTAEVIGVGAVKWSFLKISPFKYLAFDLDESLKFEGDSGPYLQYTYARARSILREAKEFKKSDLTKFAGQILDSSEEKLLLRWLTRFPEVVQNAGKTYSPNLICDYLFDLAQKFNLFYKKHPVLKAEKEADKIARLALTEAVSIIIKNGLNLLGIKTVEKM